MDRVVVRFGEIGTKSPSVRRRMADRLRANLTAALADRDLPGTADRIPGRIVLETPAVDAAAAAAAALPGVVSASPARGVPPTAEAITDALVALARDRVGDDRAEDDAGDDDRTVDSYAVRVSRARDDQPFTSPELEREAGAAIGEVLDATVDLEEPGVTFEADVRPDRAFVFTDRRDGPGGLPVGTQAPLVALVSGGIDSPVAAFEALRRGSPVVPVYVDLGDYGGVDHRARAIEACGVLAERAPTVDCRPYVVPGGDTVAAIASTVERGRMLVLRRYFFAVADAIADREDAAGIVTGEALGQKSSQTAANLRVTSAAVERPIHRPLLAVDKPDIEARARELGTYGTAAISAGCNRLAPDRPETAGRLADVREVEPPDLLERARADADGAERVDTAE